MMESCMTRIHLSKCLLTSGWIADTVCIIPAVKKYKRHRCLVIGIAVQLHGLSVQRLGCQLSMFGVKMSHRL